MDDNTIQQLKSILPALQSLNKAVTRAYHSGSYAGTGKMAVRTYSVLHSRIADLLPDDIYVTDALRLDLDEDASEESQGAQVMLAAGQLTSYLEALIKEHRRASARGEFEFEFDGDASDWRQFGQNLREQIVTNTREALRRAMDGIENMPEPPKPPKPPKVRVDIRHEGDGDPQVNVDVETEDEDTPDEPPRIV